MGRRYSIELSELGRTYELASAAPLAALAAALRSIDSGPVVFIGTGGTLTLAAFAAQEHMRRTGQAATSLTPLAFVANIGTNICAAIVMFSARARHPDIAEAARAAREQSIGPVVLVTQRTVDDLDPALSVFFDRIVTVPAVTSDGFLATNSLLAMTTAWVSAAGYLLPSTLNYIQKAPDEVLSPKIGRIVVLHGAEHRLAAWDFETRISESGVAAVQVADLRSIAHGRHVGLAREGQQTALLVIKGPESRKLAAQTVALLPPVHQITILDTQSEFPAGALDCLVGGMHLFGRLATAHQIDPGRPAVAAAGRRLYHLKWTHQSSRIASNTKQEAVSRKLLAANIPRGSDTGRQLYARHFDSWLVRAESVVATGVVLDYDGTCCTTSGRLEPLRPEVTYEIIRLLEHGVAVGFCSGRGRSLHESLRQWVPPSLWVHVRIGMYNGGLIQGLDDDVAPRCDSDGVLGELSEHLQSTLVGTGFRVTGRLGQVTIDGDGPTTLSCVAVENIVRSIVAASGAQLKVHASGHSLDVVPTASSKLNIIESLHGDATKIIAVGDRGGLGGNDFELLASVGIGLSVDEVSADPDRCWNVAAPGRKGPDALVSYLRAITAADGTATVRLDELLA